MLSAAVCPFLKEESSRRPGGHTRPLMVPTLPCDALLDLGYLATSLSPALTRAATWIFFNCRCGIVGIHKLRSRMSVYFSRNGKRRKVVALSIRYLRSDYDDQEDEQPVERKIV